MNKTTEQTMETSQLTEFLESFGEQISDNNINLYRAIIEGSELKQFDDYDDFYLSVIYPFENFIEAFVGLEISRDSDVVFLMKNSQFVARHFQEVIQQKEGFACCADKSRTIVRSLINHFKTSEKISFNYDGEYTYHLPKDVF